MVEHQALPLPLALLTLPVLATLAGGLVSLRLRRFHVPLIALGAGLLLGAAFLDILPEAIALGERTNLSAADVLAFTLLFYLLFLILETALDVWSRRRAAQAGRRRTIGRIAGSMLIFHSFRDGMAIGAAFAASHTAGYAVAAGIVAHDFGDGMNTVLLTTGGEKADWSDYLFLAMDAIAPFLGGLLTVWWLLSSQHAAILLTLAAGFFLQMATNDFIPQLRTGPRQLGPHRPNLLVAGVAGGAALIYAGNHLLAGRW